MSKPVAAGDLRLNRLAIPRSTLLSEALSTHLRQRIGGSGLKPGERLPTEKALSEAFGVSRAVVREAFAQLKADGLIETRQGSGTYVAQVPKSLNLRFWRGESPELAELHEIFELRTIIEVAVAEFAARRRTEGDLERIAEHFQAMDDALVSGRDGTESDDDFHLTIAAATHNRHIYRLAEFLGRHFSGSRKLAWKGTLQETAHPREAQAEHLALFSAIRDKDPALARRRAQEHLRGAAGRFGIKLALDVDNRSSPTSKTRNGL